MFEITFKVENHNSTGRKENEESDTRVSVGSKGLFLLEIDYKKRTLGFISPKDCVYDQKITKKESYSSTFVTKKQSFVITSHPVVSFSVPQVCYRK